MKVKLHFLHDYMFPNMILPNATIPEFGVITYLHTLYSNRIQEGAFFDFQGGPQNPATLIFDNKLGEWPTSLRHNGTHLNANVYKEHIEYVEDSLYIGRKYLNKYIYPIKITPHIDKFVGVNLKGGDRLNGEYFWKHMSAEALKDAQLRRALIFIDYAQENFIDRGTFDNLHYALKYSGIPKEQVVLAMNSFNSREVYESWYAPHERMLEVRDCPYLIAGASSVYESQPNRRLTLEQFQATRSVKRSNYFLLKIRNARKHRLALLFNLASSGLLDKADWSCLQNHQISEQEINHVSKLYNMPFNLDAVNQVAAQIPKTLNYETDLNYGGISAWTDNHAKPNADSYFEVCTETYMHGEYKSLTEKVFKPIVNFSPFIFVAFPGALALLRQIGFKTFDGFIDESYDLETDEVKRMHLMIKEITRLCSMSVDQLHDWYWSMEDILIHNHNHMMTFKNGDAKAIELIKYLDQRVNQ
jgi:hypothetical protein